MKIYLVWMVCIALLVGCELSRTDEEYLALAQDYLEEGEVNSALIETKNALRVNPENLQARMLLGRLHFMSGNVQAAEKEFIRAKELGAMEADFIVYLGTIYLEQGMLEELMDLSVDDLSNDNKAKMLAIRGLAHLSRNEIQQAAKEIRDASKLSADLKEVTLAQAGLDFATGQLKQARLELSRLIELSPNEAQAWSLLGDVARAEGKLEEAETNYGKAIAVSTRASIHQIKRAQVRIQLEKYDAARKDVDDFLRINSNHPIGNYILGQVYVFDDKLDEALTSFENAYLYISDYPPLLYNLSLTHFQLGNFQQAEQYGNQYLSLAGPSGEMLARKLLSAILYQNAKYSDAEEHLRIIVETDPNDIEAMNLLVSVLFQQGRKAESLELSNAIAKMKPDSAYYQYRLGANLLLEGDASGGEAVLEKVSKLDPDLYQADIALVMLNLKQNEAGKALLLAERFKEKNSKSPDAYNLLGYVHIHRKNLSEAKESFKGALRINPSDITANTNLAQIALYEGKTEVARNYYQAILKVHKNYFDTLMRLVALEESDNNKDAMKEYLQLAISSNPEELSPRIVMARLFLEENEPEKVASLFVEFDEQQINSSDQALFVIAKSQLAMKDYGSTLLTSRKLQDLHPNSAKVEYLRALAFAGSGDLENMEGALTKALELRPDFVDARIALISYLANVDLQRAYSQLRELKLLDPDNPAISKLSTSINKRVKDPQTALMLYKENYKNDPSTKSVLLLARQHINLGDYISAISLLESWVKKSPEDVQPRLYLASAYRSNGDSDEMVIEQYEKALMVQPDNVVALNDLAWVTRDMDPRLALDYALKANRLRSNDASILDTLAVVQLSNGNPKAALDSISQALEIAPKRISIILHAAKIEVAIGNVSSAKERLTMLLDEFESFPERAEAIELLRSL